MPDYLKKKFPNPLPQPKKTVTSDNDIISEKVPSSTQVFNFHLVNEIKNMCIDKSYEKSQLVV